MYIHWFQSRCNADLQTGSSDVLFEPSLEVWRSNMDALLLTILHEFFIFSVSTNDLSLFSDYRME